MCCNAMDPGSKAPCLKSDIQIYCDYLGEVRARLDAVQSFIGLTTGVDACNVEAVFLLFRKILELIAFTSLTANKRAYAAVHKKFAEHWKANTMFDALRKLNPNFYPVAPDPPQETAPGRKHFPQPDEGYMTIPEFVALYDAASDLLHTRNPFSDKDPTVELHYPVQDPVQEWVMRIRRLLGWHFMHLLSGDRWIVHMPPQGDVQAWPASPTN